MAILTLCAALIVGQAEAPVAEETGVEPAAPLEAELGLETEAIDAPPAAAPAELPPDAEAITTPPARPRPPSFSRRTWKDLCTDPAHAQDPACRVVPGVGAEVERPAVLQPRSMVAAALLGGLVGFGTGFFYGGDNLQGTIFAAVDSGLWISLTAAVIAMNQLVIRNDFRTFRSLSRGERPFGRWETNYYALSWAAAGLLVCSHLYQLIAGPFAARTTNRSLAGVSVIPLDGGGSVQLGFGW